MYCLTSAFWVKCEAIGAPAVLDAALALDWTDDERLRESGKRFASFSSDVLVDADVVELTDARRMSEEVDDEPALLEDPPVGALE